MVAKPSGHKNKHVLPASCFSGRAGFSDLYPPDEGWSQNPMLTVLCSKSVICVRSWYIISALNKSYSSSARRYLLAENMKPREIFHGGILVFNMNTFIYVSSVSNPTTKVGRHQFSKFLAIKHLKKIKIYIPNLTWKPGLDLWEVRTILFWAVSFERRAGPVSSCCQFRLGTREGVGGWFHLLAIPGMLSIYNYSRPG